jgi:hypothetical protein
LSAAAIQDGVKKWKCELIDIGLYDKFEF